MSFTGTLALVGSGEYLPPMDPVDQALLSRLAEPRVVCLPTAAGTEGAATIARWSRMGVEHFSRLGAQVVAVEVVDRATAEDEALAARIRSGNFVYLSGGHPGYLYRTLKDTRAYRAILDVLGRGGVVAGCSAGAMIWGGDIPRFNLLRPFQPAFGLLPGTVILPHFDEMPPALVRVARFMLGRRTLVGVEGNTALMCSDGACTVVGSGAVTVWSQRNRGRFADGQTAAW